MSGRVEYGPQENHFVSWWQARQHDPNVLFISYEDMLNDFAATVQGIAEFIAPCYAASKLTRRLIKDMYVRPVCLDEDDIADTLVEIEESLQATLLARVPDTIRNCHLGLMQRRANFAPKDKVLGQRKAGATAHLRKGTIGDSAALFTDTQYAVLLEVLSTPKQHSFILNQPPLTHIYPHVCSDSSAR
jgi:hypothetical protein